MRHIEYRGKRLDNNEWIYGDLRKRNYEHSYRIVSKDIEDEREGYGFLFHEVDPNTIGQYIGFCDKKGRKIFEDDIVRVHFNDFPYSDEDDIGIIEWEMERYDCPAFDIFPHDLDCNYLSTILATGEYTIVVLGNKHDNNELLRRYSL